MGGPALRAETADGTSYDDPSAALLRRLLGELAPGNQFLVIDRLDAVNDEHYMQVYREGHGIYAVEYREGAADHHFEAMAGDLHEVHDVLTGWAAGAPGWREIFDWRPWPDRDAQGRRK